MSLLQQQMLDALELFHYSLKFREHVFVICLEDYRHVPEIIDDLRVLRSSHIRIILCCPHHLEIENIFKGMAEIGLDFEYVRIDGQFESLCGLKKDIGQVLSHAVDLVLGLDLSKSKGEPWPVESLSFEVARFFGATKVFFLTSEPGLVVDGVLQSCSSDSEIQQYVNSDFEINIGKEKLNYLHEQRKGQEVEIVLLETSSGALFEEIFTHGGKGTLLSDDYPNVFRRAVSADTVSISLLMKPYVANNRILPMPVNQIHRQIDNFYVYTVNGQIVATACFVDHGDCLELAKVCTLSRYQHKGRATKLINQMLEIAQGQRRKFVFSLSIDPMMWRFLLKLGFEKIERDCLPMSWQQGYDFKRPSRAFKFVLER